MEFNKMFVMLPVMFLARKLDGEDPNVVYWLRVAYGTVQLCCILIVAYTYIQASAISGSAPQVVYVPPPPTPFADPNAKKKYTEVSYGAHLLSTSRSLLGSTIFGAFLTVVLHYWKGMIIGLAIQTVMAPLNLLENAIVKALLLGNGFRLEDRIFEEKLASELTPQDEVVDGNGNPVARQIGGEAGAANKGASVSFEDLLLDTWDAGDKADIGTLMSAITKKNCNYQTKESKWTPLMILAGLNAKGTVSAIRQVKEKGGNPAIADVEGWNALHWSAFHGNLEAARELAKDRSLLTVKDKEGKTAFDLATTEGNAEVAKFLETFASETVSSGVDSSGGLRRRK